MKWIKSQIWEIERSPLLCYFAAILAQIHVMTYFHWIGNARIGDLDICWDFAPNCATLPLVPEALNNYLFGTYLVSSCLALLLFLWRRFTGAAWFFFFLTTLSMLLIYASEAQLQNSIHSIVLMLSLTILFIPNKGQLIRFVILSSYIVSAFGKASTDWLSGATLQGFIHLPLKGLEWVAAFALLVEMATPVLLLSRTAQLLFAGLGILASYHITHFIFFRDFAAVAHTLLLVYFILEFFETGRLERESFYQSYEHPEPSKLWWPIAGIVFVMAQMPLWPARVPAQLFRLEVMAKVSDCRYIAFGTIGNETQQVLLAPPEGVSPNYRCHETVARHVAQEWCDSHHDATPKLYFSFMRRSLGQSEFKKIFSLENVCSKGVSP